MSETADHWRLTPFEHYMLADDRAAYPMDFFFRFRFEGILDRRCLEQSLAETASRQPLLTSVVSGARPRFFWHPAGVAPRLRVAGRGENSSLLDFPAIDPRQQSGLQAAIETHGRSSHLWLQVHHCCADAVGVLQFVKLWFDRYKALLAGESPQPLFADASTFDREMAVRFARPELSAWRYLSPSRQERKRLLGFALNRPRRIASPFGQLALRQPERTRPQMVTASFPLSREAWQMAKTRLPVPASINDSLLTGLFRALARWNDRMARTQEKYCLRIAMPIDLRSTTGERATAMNSVSFVFIDRSAKEIRDRELLDGIYRETDWIKKNHGAYVLQDVLKALQPLPGGMESLVAPITCTATTILSNLGELSSYLPHSDRLAVGKARLTGVDFLPPIRPGTLAALGVVTYAGRLQASLHFDVRKLSVPLADDLLTSITTDWKTLLSPV
jgi:hypothetical protein